MTENNITQFKPSMNVVVYKDRHDHRHYLQVHNIDDKGIMGEGKPFQREQLQQLALSLRNEQISSLKLKSLLPENVLFFQPGISGSNYMWFIPAQEHFITFTKEVKIPTSKYKFPGLILAVINKDLYIFAYKGKGKPSLKTELFHAPFHNVYDDGNVCMGTISESRRKAFLHEEMDRWERRFFGGRFTDANGDDNHFSKDFTMKKAYALMRGASFPEKVLAPAKYKTIESFVKKLVEGGKDE